MLFNSIDFLIFFPIVVLIYYVIPQRIRHIWLLVASYYFYMCWNAKYAILIIISTVVTYIAGILIQRVSHRKLVLAGSLVINLGILLYYKYADFLVSIIVRVFEHLGIRMTVPAFDIMLPVGISFYTFQALGYTIDAYRNRIKAEKNFIRYALFVSFFPQLVAGPIERSENLLSQFDKTRKFDFDRAREGFMLMLWGYFLKIVIADRIAPFVDTVYGDHLSYPGMYLVAATVLFAMQIYCDFAGYSTIAIGAAKILGIDLMENFNAPYLATTVAGFWRGWHISLTSWFKDYLYIPLGGNRKGRLRKYLNKLIVFLISGLWHGADFTFVIWGGLNGLYQIIGEVLQPVRRKAAQILHFNGESLPGRLLRMLATFVFVDFAWIFFRADNGVRNALDIIKSMLFTWNPGVLFNGSLFDCGIDKLNFVLLFIAVLLLLIDDVCKVRNIKVRNIILQRPCWMRWVMMAASTALILLFGKWGPAFDKANFIYFQF